MHFKQYSLFSFTFSKQCKRTQTTKDSATSTIVEACMIVNEQATKKGKNKCYEPVKGKHPGKGSPLQSLRLGQQSINSVKQGKTSCFRKRSPVPAVFDIENFKNQDLTIECRGK